MPKLTSLAIGRQNTPGKYRDENGLILQVTKNRSGQVRKSWLVRYSIFGKQREIGLGTFPDISLADARIKAAEIRLEARKGADPIKERLRIVEEQKDELESSATFLDCAEKFISSHEQGWSNAKHRQQWRNTLKTYAYPVIGKIDVADISVKHMLKILEPIWYSKTETANRVRGRIENIISWAIARGYRAPPNPATWRGHLEMLLPKPTKIRPVKHHAAMDWKDLPGFFCEIQRRPGVSSRALEFTILTAARSGEVRRATWSEIDADQALWTIPAERMKMRRDHRVPLSQPALDILKYRKRNISVLPTDLIFYNSSPRIALSDAVYRALYERMRLVGITTHGFRSSFRDWVGETTNHARETAELALAHSIGDATERAYRRGDALEKRRVLMDDWAKYCISKRSNTVTGDYDFDRNLM